ncbi:putative RING-H2 finger protein ATL12 [Platanthera zijinensis]|uniref:RING-H2 finger protein ATL12 n=1 Tax=Platanthera zijinensis TaxID=2320716 RepID=A0AAP0FUE0_9ASPA
MMGSGFSLITTVIGFGMSAAFIVFVCARLICGRIRSPHLNAAAIEIEVRSNRDLPDHEIHGVDPILVAAIPTIKYCREAFRSKEDAQCSICLAEYQEKDVLRVMPTCLHNFHLTCIDEWLEKHLTCPICRLPLNTNDARLVPPFATGFPFHRDHSLTWLLPTHQHSGSSNRNQEMLGSVSVVIGVQH